MRHSPFTYSIFAAQMKEAIHVYVAEGHRCSAKRNQVKAHASINFFFLSLLQFWIILLDYTRRLR
jgi:hypothetical protein